MATTAPSDPAAMSREEERLEEFRRQVILKWHLQLPRLFNCRALQAVMNLKLSVFQPAQVPTQRSRH